MVPRVFRILCAALLGAAAGRAADPAPLRAEAAPPSGGIVAGTTSMAVLDSSRRLGPGDRLSYRVVQERRLPISLVVADSGEVEVPLIGRVPAAGRTCKDLAENIKPLLEREYFIHATVIVGLDSVSAKPRGRVYLSGPVRQQGSIEIPADEHFTVSKAILKAGGFAEFADKKKVKLVRKAADGGPAQTMIVDVDAVISHGRVEQDRDVQPDDSIIVPQKFINF